MRAVITFLLCVSALGGFGQNKSYDYCYLKGSNVVVYSAADKKATPVLNSRYASDACISPDGKTVAYTAISANGDRNIGLINLNTRKKSLLNTGSKNCYGPVWSPDGKKIAYNVFNDQTSNWAIAVIDVENGAPSVITAQLTQCFMPTWLANSQNIAVQDMSAVYVFDLSGTLLGTYDISAMMKGLGPTSSDRFIFTNNYTRIVFSAEVDEPSVDNEGDPPSAVFAYDISSKKTTRLTPKGYSADDIWVKGNTVYCTAYSAKSGMFAVYTVGLDGKNLRILFPVASNFSAKN
ncbi:MAG TPA: hypothetical protein VHC47_01930 [Mucilaginibacter sp.]|nr:hypothetical protein [Mucilaginibacter sp.]